MEKLFELVGDYGPGTFLAAALVYLLVKGQITFRYPRPKKK